MLIETIIFIVGFIFLFKGSQIVIDSSIKISEYLGISRLAVGFIIVAMATSIPDFMVAVNASLIGETPMAIGDALGSSIANITLVLGIAALIRNLNVKREQTIASAELLFLISLVPLIILSRGTVTQIEGMLLLLFFAFYCFFILKKKFTMNITGKISKKESKKAFFFFVIGISIVILSAHFVVSSGASIASSIGISSALIGMTVIAFGTTLPELAIDLAAIRKGHTALAVGDILGSCVINLTLVMGTAIIINPIGAAFEQFSTAIIILVVVNSLLTYALLKHEGITKTLGIVFILIYILFLLIQFSSGLI
ncbi:MAG: hypothetical protein ABIE23_02625 [archaeon]|nr:hypothetical protein [Candidatus Micrarchaeota archaeon]